MRALRWATAKWSATPGVKLRARILRIARVRSRCNWRFARLQKIYALGKAQFSLFSYRLQGNPGTPRHMRDIVCREHGFFLCTAAPCFLLSSRPSVMPHMLLDLMRSAQRDATIEQCPSGTNNPSGKTSAATVARRWQLMNFCPVSVGGVPVA